MDLHRIKVRKEIMDELVDKLRQKYLLTLLNKLIYLPRHIFLHIILGHQKDQSMIHYKV